LRLGWGKRGGKRSPPAERAGKNTKGKAHHILAAREEETRKRKGQSSASVETEMEGTARGPGKEKLYHSLGKKNLA